MCESERALVDLYRNCVEFPFQFASWSSSADCSESSFAAPRVWMFEPSSNNIIVRYLTITVCMSENWWIDTHLPLPYRSHHAQVFYGITSHKDTVLLQYSKDKISDQLQCRYRTPSPLPSPLYSYSVYANLINTAPTVHLPCRILLTWCLLLAAAPAALAAESPAAWEAAAEGAGGSSKEITITSRFDVSHSILRWDSCDKVISSSWNKVNSNHINSPIISIRILQNIKSRE